MSAGMFMCNLLLKESFFKETETQNKQTIYCCFHKSYTFDKYRILCEMSLVYLMFQEFKFHISLC